MPHRGYYGCTSSVYQYWVMQAMREAYPSLRTCAQCLCAHTVDSATWSCLAMAFIGFSLDFLSFPPYDGLHLLEKQWLTVLLSVADDSKLAASSFLSLETHFAKFHKAIISRSLWLAWKSVSISLSRVITHIPIYPSKYTRSTTKRLKTKCLDR